ncbi:hypothetical protein [Alteromonas sp. C1M14]|uniref:hypothetical protein n=1 Tax=Alteromonas sp. C1M14 TaxID=2841567 RepID=UPI001C0928C1|nr:hypothetical protein [Alteromonas sp. C1M14]MBU2978221.1 hypothetical protein [Alteromonas sp. C1M14]
MTKILLLTGLFFLSLFARATPSLVVMGADGENSAIAITDPIYSRVTTAIVEQMVFRGFTTYADNDIFTLDYQRTGKRTDKRVKALARSIQSQPIDILVQFTIHLHTPENQYKTRKAVKARLVGKLIYIATGEALGSFETKASDSWFVPINCTSVCLSESVGSYASWLAEELGAVLAEMLDHEVNRPDFTYKHQINFVQMSDEHIARFMAALPQAEGYVNVVQYKDIGVMLSSRQRREKVAVTLQQLVSGWSVPVRVEQLGSVFSVSVNASPVQQEKQEVDVSSIFN